MCGSFSHPTRTTGLYDRRTDQLTFEKVERILI